MRLKHPMIAWLALATLTALSAHAANAQEVVSGTGDRVLDLSLTELSEISVTSVSKQEEKASAAAAAIYVITQEDIRRSGATAIPELLRMAPGITVTRAGSGSWTVTARGSNDQFSNKLLVLMDGRTIYSPLFSGVIWDVQDTVLEDIDRIEVIRGPGATLWGANAVNGVINIITKRASDTQGGYASFTAGNQIQGIGTVRYGTALGDTSHLRAYAKRTQYNSETRPNGSTANDNWKKSQAGFRADGTLEGGDKFTVQGDAYSVDEDANFTIPDLTSGTFTSSPKDIEASGVNALVRYDTKHSGTSQTTVQAYVDHTFYKTSFFNDTTDTLDLDVQNVWTGMGGHEFVWGAGYRLIMSENDPQSAQYSLTPKRRNDNLFNAFVQDKITLLSDELFLTLGSKFEKNDYTGLEIQPSARMSWLVDDSQTLWSSVSRAVHTPYRYTDDGFQALGVVAGPAYAAFAGNKSLESEELIAYELGYRIQPTASLAFDLAGFYNEYDNLIYVKYGTPTTFLPITTDNSDGGTSLGGELSAQWNVSKQWQLAGAYSYIDLTFDKKNSVAFSYVGKHPKHQFNVRSTYLFNQNLEMSNALYYVDDLTGINIPSRYRFDTRVSYAIAPGVDVSLVGQNLLDDRTQEFTPFVYRASAEIGRSIYGNVSLKF